MGKLIQFAANQAVNQTPIKLVFKKEMWGMISELIKKRKINISNHAFKQGTNREINDISVCQVIKKGKFEIVQGHEAGAYRNNEDPVFVLYAQIKRTPIHIVVAVKLDESYNQVVTVYYPNPSKFLDCKYYIAA